MAAKREGRKPDDLTRIEGIGPKTRDFLLAQGIRTFAALSKRTANDLRELLDEAPGRVATRDPATWPEQARLASLGNWNSLEQLQERLQHGVEVPPAPDREEELTFDLRLDTAFRQGTGSDGGSSDPLGDADDS